MNCNSPIGAWILKKEKTENGKQVVSFKEPFQNYDESYAEGVLLPCGQCISCRLERSKQWAIRCVHEAQMHEYNSFITLTYNKKYLPINGSLVKSDFQKFIKRLRKKIEPLKIRFFHCGEYGENFKRPHYHACIFGYDFPDRVLWSVRDSVKLYRSRELESLWCNPKTRESMGFCTVGEVTFESAAYVARYVTKKINGERAERHYGARLPEYVTMSRRPGIGGNFYELYKDDMYAHDRLVVKKGLITKPPRYYDRLYDVENSERMKEIKAKRKEVMLEDQDVCDKRRRKVIEQIKLVNNKQLIRSFENEHEENLLNV